MHSAQLSLWVCPARAGFFHGNREFFPKSSGPPQRALSKAAPGFGGLITCVQRVSRKALESSS